MKLYHTVSNKVWGGGEQTVLDLSRRQLADGIEVEIFCVPQEAVIAQFRSLGVPIHVMSLGGALDFGSALKMSRVLKYSTAIDIHVHNFKEAFTAQAIGRLIDDDDLRQRMGRKAKADFDDHLSYEHFYSRIKEIY